jgi:adenylylsulfate kinase-like enzyme
MGIPVLLLTGAVGVGKTTVSYEVRLRLAQADVRHVLIDDEFALVHPHPIDDLLGERVRARALRALWAIYEDAGIDRLVLSRVIESDGDLEQIRSAIPDADVQVYWLVAPFEVLAERIRSKGVPTAEEGCLNRAADLLQIWDSNPIRAQVVDTVGRSVPDIADEVVTKSGWLRP